MKYEAKLRNFFLSLSNGYSMIYDNFDGIRDHLKLNLELQLCRNRKKIVCVLAETHINLDQIHHIRNSWLCRILFFPGDSHTKGFLVLLHLGLEGVTEVDTDPKGRFVSLMVTPFIVVTPENSCLDGVSLKDYKIIWKIKMRVMKTK